jgi:hypothetical protein
MELKYELQPLPTDFWFWIQKNEINTGRAISRIYLMEESDYLLYLNQAIQESFASTGSPVFIMRWIQRIPTTEVTVKTCKSVLCLPLTLV